MRSEKQPKSEGNPDDIAGAARSFLSGQKGSKLGALKTLIPAALGVSILVKTVVDIVTVNLPGLLGDAGLAAGFWILFGRGKRN